MYKIYINDVFFGMFKTESEAMAVVNKQARPFNSSWHIKDGFEKVIAQGS